MTFVDRNILRAAIDGGARGKNQLVDACSHHGLQQCQRRRHVVLVVLARVSDRLAHFYKRGEVQHRIKLIFGEQGIEGSTVSDVQFDPPDIAPGGRVIGDHHVMTGT
ncbi:hypothetical protein D9M71_570410 [compost metagenome]